MKFIAHRGNINGRNIELENDPYYLLSALHAGYDIEVDVWGTENGLYLGHDKPQFSAAPIMNSTLYTDTSRYWFHAKNLKAVHYLQNYGLNWFVIDKEEFTYTKNGQLWTSPSQKFILGDMIIVMPEDYRWDANLLSIIGQENKNQPYGICSDYIEKWKNWCNRCN